MDLNKTDHFLDFIFCNCLLQDVAYGTTNLNFFNRKSQILLHAVIAARYEHISYHIKFCESRNVGTIIRDIKCILKTLKPSQRRRWEGLDNTVGEGLNVSIMLKEIVDHYMGRRKTVLEKLEQGKRYQKIGFPQHCTDYSECPSYCINLPLFESSTLL